MDLSVTTSAAESHAVLLVSGSIDIASRDQLATAARNAIADGAVSLVVDMSEVGFIDSTGIGALVRIASEVDDAGGSFAVRAPSRPVLRILDTAGLAQDWVEQPVDSDS